MNFKQLVLNRYSCRNYLNTPVSDKLINELFETCRFAPSAVNLQPWEFIVVTETNLLKKLQHSYKRDWLQTAPVIVIALGNKSKAWVRSDGKNHSDIDLSIFIDHFTLAATNKGLATCWICNFNIENVIADFEIPDHLKPIALLPLGYPVEKEIPLKKRKNLEEIVHFNKIS